jgi:hypothetical protein
MGIKHTKTLFTSTPQAVPVNTNKPKIIKSAFTSAFIGAGNGLNGWIIVEGIFTAARYVRIKMDEVTYKMVSDACALSE